MQKAIDSGNTIFVELKDRSNNHRYRVITKKQANWALNYYSSYYKCFLFTDFGKQSCWNNPKKPVDVRDMFKFDRDDNLRITKWLVM